MIPVVVFAEGAFVLREEFYDLTAAEVEKALRRLQSPGIR